MTGVLAKLAVILSTWETKRERVGVKDDRGLERRLDGRLLLEG
jgi:hypothetical protein